MNGWLVLAAAVAVVLALAGLIHWSGWLDGDEPEVGS